MVFFKGLPCIQHIPHNKECQTTSNDMVSKKVHRHITTGGTKLLVNCSYTDMGPNSVNKLYCKEHLFISNNVES